MYIYRIENKGQTGPFQAHFAMYNLTDLDRNKWNAHMYKRNGVMWILAKLGKEANLYHCACTSLAQLKDWFMPFLPQLESKGFHIHTYFIDPEDIVIVDENQVLFKFQDATLLNQEA